MSKPLLAAALAMALAACANSGAGATAAGQCTAGADAGTSEAGLAQKSLCIDASAKTHSFTVEMAVSPQQQAQGLMFRTSLADDKGMLFPFAEVREASFWMKNTVIPLDIIFIRADGRIENIAQNTTPYSTDPVVSTGPVAAVLELRGGLTAELGIKKGDRVRWTKGK